MVAASDCLSWCRLFSGGSSFLLQDLWERARPAESNLEKLQPFRAGPSEFGFFGAGLYPDG